MPTVNSADFQINAGGDLRRASSPATTDIYNVLDMHAWLQDLADNAEATGDDTVSMLGANPSELAGKRNATRPAALTLLNGVNIDDSVSQFLKFGSIEQLAGAVLYTGLKTIGSPLVAASPIYVVQNLAKVSRWWGAASGHIQVLIKCKVGGALIDSGNVTVFSRKWGQTFAHFDANLSAGGEQVAAITTQLDSSITMLTGNFTGGANTITLASPAGVVTLTFADTTQALGGVSKAYKGTISWTGSLRLSEVYQALQWAASESSTATLNAIEGWRYRSLDHARALGAGYPEVPSAPFGTFSGGKLFAAQGWWIDTASLHPSDLKAYQLIAHDGVTVTPPSSAVISIGALAVGDRVLVGKDDGVDMDEATGITATGSAAASTVTLSGAPASDVPTGAGFIRIAGKAHTYTGIVGTTVSGLSPVVPVGGYSAAATWFPYVDVTADGATESSGNFIMGSGASFTARVRVRNGGGSPIQPFETTFAVTEAGGGGSVNAIRNPDA